MQSIEDLGRDKTVGGDEYYVTYVDDRSARDAHLNESSFTTPGYVTLGDPPAADALGQKKATGTLVVHFQGSCGIGLLPPPARQGPMVQLVGSFVHHPWESERRHASRKALPAASASSG